MLTKWSLSNIRTIETVKFVYTLELSLSFIHSRFRQHSVNNFIKNLVLIE